jgi:hypothetical protein
MACMMQRAEEATRFHSLSHAAEEQISEILHSSVPMLTVVGIFFMVETSWKSGDGGPGVAGTKGRCFGV